MSSPPGLRQTLPKLSHVVGRFTPYLRSRKWLIVGGLAALFAEVFMRLLEPWPLKFVFDGVFANLTKGTTLPQAEALGPMSLLALCAISLVVILGFRALCAYLSTIAFALVGNRVLMEVRRDVFQHLQRLSLKFHTNSRSGDLIVRVISDIGMLKEVAVTAALPLLANVLILFGMIGVMFWMHWQLTLVALTVLPLFWLTGLKLGGRLRKVSRQQRKREGALANTAAESLGSIKIVQALGLESRFEEDFGGRNQQELKAGVKAKRLSAGLERIVDVLVAIATALVLWFGARLVLSGELTPGDLLVFMAYLKSAFRPMRDLAKYTGRLAKAAAAGERILDIFDARRDIDDLPDAQPAPPLRGAITFENVSFGYEDDHPVLHGVDLRIEPGQTVALVGPSGNGKSTLASLIMRLYDPQHGRILIDGKDIRDYTLASLRGQMALVMQDNLLFATDIRDNISCTQPDATEEQIIEAAELANANGFICALPQGYDTVVGERGATLSSGQRQRIAVARAAIRQTPILILDEPTAALDENNQRLVSEALQRLGQDRSTLLITHDLSQAAGADWIVYLENGRIAEQGTYPQLMAKGGRYAELYRQQATGSVKASVLHSNEQTVEGEYRPQGASHADVS